MSDSFRFLVMSHVGGPPFGYSRKKEKKVRVKEKLLIHMCMFFS